MDHVVTLCSFKFLKIVPYPSLISMETQFETNIVAWLPPHSVVHQARGRAASKA